jgi:hypothetical protein
MPRTNRGGVAVHTCKCSAAFCCIPLMQSFVNLRNCCLALSRDCRVSKLTLVSPVTLRMNGSAGAFISNVQSTTPVVHITKALFTAFISSGFRVPPVLPISRTIVWTMMRQREPLIPPTVHSTTPCSMTNPHPYHVVMLQIFSYKILHRNDLNSTSTAGVHLYH